MLNVEFSPWPSYTDEEVQAVGRVLTSNRVNYWTGDEGRAFEREFAEWVGTEHAIAVGNGTLALDLALRGLGVGPGDEVVVTPRSFIASASCVVTAGATPVFADVDPNSGNLSAETIARVLTKRTRAVIPVHLGGWPCDMDPIMELAEKHGLAVIEDCAQAHGAMYKGRSVGSIGHVGAWSFCQDKIMTTGGEGGMVTTNDRQLWSRMWSYKDHGKGWDAVYEREHAPGFRWLHEDFGTNWRLTEMQSAIGRIQLRRMPHWSAKRREHAMAIDAALAPFSGPDGPVRLPPVCCPSCQPNSAPANCVHAYYKYYAYVRPDRLATGWDRDRVVQAISAQGVPCYQGTCSEIYRERAFDGFELRLPQRLEVARQLGETSLMLLVHPTLTSAEIERTCAALRETLTQCCVST